MQIPPKYIVGTIIFALIVSFGIMSLTYRPQPVQVQVNQYEPIRQVPVYTPAPVPQPASTTIPIPTSMPSFDPAPPPVVITTDPDPKGTTGPLITCSSTGDPKVSQCEMGSDLQKSTEAMEDLTLTMLGLAPVLVIFGLIIGLLNMMLDLNRRDD